MLNGRLLGEKKVEHTNVTLSRELQFDDDEPHRANEQYNLVKLTDCAIVQNSRSLYSDY